MWQQLFANSCHSLLDIILKARLQAVLYFTDFLSVCVVKFSPALTSLNITVSVMFSSFSLRVEEAEVVYPDGKTCIYPVLYHPQLSEMWHMWH